MDRCQHCQAQMLDFLYDLLDEPDQMVLESHLADCEDCRHALHFARGQQHLFATAAKLDCAAVRFQPPPRETTQPLGDPLEQPRVLPLRRRNPIRWNTPWIAAAAALLVLIGASLYAHHDYETANATLAKQQQATRERNSELAALQMRRKDVARHEQDAIRKIDTRQERGELVVKALGPQVLASKNSAAFEVETRDAQGGRVSARVESHLRRGKDVVPLQAHDAANGRIMLRLAEPENLAPGEYELLVSAERPDGASVTLPPLPVVVPHPQAITYLTTDRPLYRAGEDVVHFRSLTLERLTLRPVQSDLLLEYVLRLPDGRERMVTQGADRLRLAGASTALLTGPDGKPLHGIGAGTFALESTLPAGEYSLLVRDRKGQVPETRTRFLVSRPGGPRLSRSPDWNHPVYQPGEAVEVAVNLVRPSGDPIRDKQVTVNLRVDGHEMLEAQPLTTDGEGRLHIQTRIPPTAHVASLQMTLRLDEKIERVQTPIPLHLPGAVIEFHPEGGNLVAGLENRVYFQARDRRGLPVALQGELLEDDRGTGVTVATTPIAGLGEASGLGSFRFTPTAGKRYRVRVDAPAATQIASLPMVQREGIILTVDEPVLEAGQPLGIHVRSNLPRSLQATLTCRGEVLQIASLPRGISQIKLPTQGARGVGRVTVVEEVALLSHELPGPSLASALVGTTRGPLGAVTLLLAGSHQKLELIPRAERLIYCRPKERLELQVKTSKSTTESGDPVRVNLIALDENRRAIPAVAQVGIVDKSAMVGADVRYERSLPADAWLASELPSADSLEYADSLLLPAAASHTALDLVLGTRGQGIFSNLGEPGQPSENLVMVHGRRLPNHSALANERRTVIDASNAQRESLLERENEVRATLTSLHEDATTAEAVVRLAWYHEQGPRWQRGFILAFGVLGLVALGVGLYRLVQAELVQAQQSLILAGGSAALLLLTITLTFPAPLSMEMASLGPDTESLRDQKKNQADSVMLERETLASVWIFESLPAGKIGWRETLEKATPLDKGAVVPGGAASQQVGAMAAQSPQAPIVYGKKDLKEFQGGFGRGGVANGFSSDPPTQNIQDSLAQSRGLNQLTLNPFKMATDKETENNNTNQGASNATAEFRRQLLEELSQEKREEAKLGTPDLQRNRRAQPLVVRTFTHEARKQVADGAARAWPPVIYWHPVLVLPGESTTLDVNLGNSPSRYRIDIQAHGLDGRLGGLRQELPTRTPKE